MTDQATDRPARLDRPDFCSIDQTADQPNRLQTGRPYSPVGRKEGRAQGRRRQHEPRPAQRVVTQKAQETPRPSNRRFRQINATSFSQKGETLLCPARPSSVCFVPARGANRPYLETPCGIIFVSSPRAISVGPVSGFSRLSAFGYLATRGSWGQGRWPLYHWKTYLTKLCDSKQVVPTP